MTKINWDDFPIIPGFDCLKWKAERQAEILRETNGMTLEEVREYIRKGAERFDEEQKRRRTEREAKAMQ
jgi:hypothetical protein